MTDNKVILSELDLRQMLQSFPADNEFIVCCDIFSGEKKNTTNLAVERKKK